MKDKMAGSLPYISRIVVVLKEFVERILWMHVAHAHGTAGAQIANCSKFVEL